MVKAMKPTIDKIASFEHDLMKLN
ncbi:MAG: hypothetical protein ACD_46C00692G0001, partial [uncultured bacterium]